ncbi:hypothetical protein ACFL6C_11460 [Myxococcota bacterium]
MRQLPVLLVLLMPSHTRAEIPAAPVMTVYQFDGNLEIPFYRIDSFLKMGPASPAGGLAQGTFLVPCLVVRGGKPVTTRGGTPFVGFEVVLDSTRATPESVEKLEKVRKDIGAKMVVNHHCDSGVQHLIDARRLISREAIPFFEPPKREVPKGEMPKRETRNGSASSHTELDQIIRAFHNSSHCAQANQRLVQRRTSLARAWDGFLAGNGEKWPAVEMKRARNLDFTMRTAIYEGHLGRGCSAYGACERNIIALSIRNRARGRCLKWQGCRFDGDFEGVATSVSQYNIWDEYLTQISGLTSCYLRDDIPDEEHLAKTRAIHTQSVGDVEKILFGSNDQLRKMFPGTPVRELQGLRHYYHPPAMGKCFPEHDRIEYISAAFAKKGDDFVLVANTWVQVGDKKHSGYLFRKLVLEQRPDEDIVSFADHHAGFVLDSRKVTLKPPWRCVPYGIPSGCRFETIGRHRKPPSWLDAGKSTELTCQVEDRGAGCKKTGSSATVKVGGRCDTKMRPMSGVH